MSEKTYLAFIAEANHVALRQFFGWPGQRLPARAIEPLDQRRLDLRFGGLPDAAAFELAGNHLGIVHHQLVTGLKPLWKVGDNAVAQDAVGLHDQHPRGIARAGRAQPDAACWKFAAETASAHGPPFIPALTPPIHLLPNT